MVCRRRAQVFVAGQIGWNGACAFESDGLGAQMRQALATMVAVQVAASMEGRAQVQIEVTAASPP